MQKTTMFKAVALALALGGSITVPATVHAQDFLVRVRALNLQSVNNDTTGLGLSVNDKTFPEVDFSYFVTPQFALELVLTYPQKHDIRSNGIRIGELKQLPPTLLAQYHFTGLGAFKPYVGAGINYTRLSGVSFTPAVVASLNPSLEKDSYGFALQLGVDYEIVKNVYLNLDVKKVQIGFDVFSGPAKAGEFKVDPVLVGLGIGYRF
jgi:outer membrane protein